MDNLFLFQFCLSDLFIKNEDAPCYARPIHGKGALSHTMTELSLLCIFVIRNFGSFGFLRLSVFSSDALNYFLPIPSHSMGKERAIYIGLIETQ